MTAGSNAANYDSMKITTDIDPLEMERPLRLGFGWARKV